MFQIVTANCEQLPQCVFSISKTFARVFSRHYANIIITAVAQKDEETLGGFEDLNQKFFSGKLKTTPKDEIIQVLEKLYRGVGFDDDAAFILKLSRMGADHHLMTYAELQNKNGRPDFTVKNLENEISDYRKCLEDEKRELTEVDFVAIQDHKYRVLGFAIYHILTKENTKIIHVRQAAVLQQHKGFVSLFARYLADKYPHCRYEANQRYANKVILKDMLIAQGLIAKKAPVLGYSEKYIGLVGNYGLERMLIDWKLRVPHKKDSLFKRFGLYGEAEDIRRRNYSASAWDNFVDHVKPKTLG